VSAAHLCAQVSTATNRTSFGSNRPFFYTIWKHTGLLLIGQPAGCGQGAALCERAAGCSPSRL